MNEKNDTIKLLSYEKVWKVEKKIYSFANLKLPIAVAPDEFFYFCGSLGFLFVLGKVFTVINILPSILRFIFIPYMAMKFLTKKKLDGKNPIKYFVGYINYICFERFTYLEHFRIYQLRQEEKMSLNWECSQGRRIAGEIPISGDVNNTKNPILYILKSININKKIENTRTIKEKDNVKISTKKNVKKDKVDTKVAVKKVNLRECQKDEKKEIKKENILISICHLSEDKSIFINDFTTGLEKLLNKDICVMDNEAQQKESDYLIYSINNLQDQNNQLLEQSKIKILICNIEPDYLKSVANFIEKQKKDIKNWKFVFPGLTSTQAKEVSYLMDDYNYFCITEPIKEKEIIRIYKALIRL